MSGWNFTVAEVGIVNRLKERVGSGPLAWARLVGTRADLAAVAEAMQMAPAVYVTYNGFAVASADEYACSLLHRWFATVAVSNVVDARESGPRNQEAGPYMASVLDALHGFTPPDCNTPLVPITPPRPYYGSAKFAYFPLAFTTTSYHCATP